MSLLSWSLPQYLRLEPRTALRYQPPTKRSPEEDGVLPADSALDDARIPHGFNGDQFPAFPATADQVADDDSREVPAQANDQPGVRLPQPASTDSAESTAPAGNCESFSPGFRETPSI